MIVKYKVRYPNCNCHFSDSKQFRPSFPILFMLLVLGW